MSANMPLHLSDASTHPVHAGQGQRPNLVSYEAHPLGLEGPIARTAVRALLQPGAEEPERPRP